MHAAGQQITDLPRVGVYEADQYCGCMIYIREFSALHSVQQTPCSPFAVTQILTTELKVVWPAIPYFVSLIANIMSTQLSR